MRTVSEAIRNAVENNITTRTSAKINVFASRHYFKGYTTDSPPTVGDITDMSPEYAASTGGSYPTPECMIYDHDTSSILTVIVNSGQLELYSNNSSDPIVTGIYCDGLSRPGIDSSYIYYYDNATGNWMRVSYDASLWITGDPDCLGTPAAYVNSAFLGHSGAIYPVGDNQAVILWIDDGAVRASFIASQNIISESPGRIFYPSSIISEDSYLSLSLSLSMSLSGDVTEYSMYEGWAAVHFGGAAKWIEPDTGITRVFIYLTTWNGKVLGTYYRDDGNTLGKWSEIFTVVPEDISNYVVGNVFSIDNTIWMIGRFSRRSDFASEAAYTLFTWSTDGKNFSLDRRTLVTTEDLRWLASYDSVDNKVAFSSENRWYIADGSYQFSPTNCYSREYHLKTLNGSTNGGWSAEAVAGREEGFDEEWLDEGTFAELLIGIWTGSDYEWVPYQQCVISQVKWGYADGQRQLSIGLAPDGIWHTSTMTYPIYTELDGKQYLYSNLKVFDTLYAQTGLQGQLWSLECDPWTTDIVGEDGYGWQTHAAGIETDVWGDDLTIFLVEYPKFEADRTYECRIYGWSRAGVPSENPNEEDTTPTGTMNDDFLFLMTVEDEEGIESTIVSTAEQLTSSYEYPPQTWYPEDTRVGSYPVIYTIPSPGANYKLIKIGARVIAHTGNTTFYIERFEMPDMVAQYTLTTESGSFVYDTVPVDALYILENTFVEEGDYRHELDGDGHFVGHTGVAPYDSSPLRGAVGPTGWVPSLTFTDVIKNDAGYNAAAYGELHEGDPGYDNTAQGGDESYQQAVVDWAYNGRPQYGIPARQSHVIFLTPDDNQMHTYRVQQVIKMIQQGTYPGIDHVINTMQLRICVDNKVPGNLMWYASTIEYRQDDDIVADLKGLEYFDYEHCHYPNVGTQTLSQDEEITVAPNTMVELCWDIACLAPSWIFSFERGLDGSLISSHAALFLCSLNLTQTGTSPIGEEIPSGTTGEVSTEQKGVPQVYFATQPYSAWNFDVVLRTKFVGPHSFVGGIGLATDQSNFLVGYIKKDYVGLMKVRNYTRTIIEENADTLYDVSLDENVYYDLRFWHRDGLFGIEYKTADTVEWPDRGSMFTYEWTEADGAIAPVVPVPVLNGEGKVTSVIDLDLIDAIVYHVGFFTIIDPPKFKTTGFENLSEFIPIMPCDINPATGESDVIKNPYATPGLQYFPNSGRVDCCHNIYTYADINQCFWYREDELEENCIEGPFQSRNVLEWVGNYNWDREDDTPYDDWQRAIEFSKFAWISDADHHDDYTNDGMWAAGHAAMMAMDDGEVWLNDQSFFKPWVTTGGEVVYQLERGRYYCIPGYKFPENTTSVGKKVWITQGLTGVVPVTSTDTGLNPENSFVYLDNYDEVSLSGFMAVSGDEDMSIQLLLDKICRISGTIGVFPGDDAQPDQTLSQDETIVL